MRSIEPAEQYIVSLTDRTSGRTLDVQLSKASGSRSHSRLGDFLNSTREAAQKPGFLPKYGGDRQN